MQTRQAASELLNQRVSIQDCPANLRETIQDFFTTWKTEEQLSKSDVLRLIFSRPELHELSNCSHELISTIVRCTGALVSRIAAEVEISLTQEALSDPAGPGRKSFLTSEQMTRLREWLRTECAAKRYPTTRRLKEEILLELEATQPDLAPCPSWYHYTIKRLLAGTFKIRNARPYDEKRYNLDAQVIAAYFQAIADPRVMTANPNMFYNTDETGFGASKSGRSKSQRVIVPVEMTQVPACQEPNESHYVTCIATATLSGRLLRPGLVTKRQTDHPDGAKCSYYSTALRYTSPKAFVNRAIFEHYFIHVIMEDILEYRRAHPDEQQTAVLIMDGHKAHVSKTMRVFCAIHDVFVILLPSHSSHLIQMLDRGVFRRAKAEYANFPVVAGRSRVSNALERAFQAYEACQVRGFLWRCWEHAGIMPIVDSGRVQGYMVQSDGILGDPSLNHDVSEGAQGRRTEDTEFGIINEDEVMIYEAGQCPFCYSELGDMDIK